MKRTYIRTYIRIEISHRSGIFDDDGVDNMSINIML